MGKIKERPIEMIIEAVKIYNDTNSAYKVASKLGISLRSAYKILHERGVNIPSWGDEKPFKRKISGDSEKTLIEDYTAGVRLKDLMDKYKCGEYAIRNAIKRNDIILRDHGGQRRRVTKEEELVIINLYRKGTPQSAIATILKCGASVVSRILTSAGIYDGRKAFGDRHGSWKGGIYQTKDGYILQKISFDDPYFIMARRNGYVPQHRYFMAQKIGRPLTKNESVHHIDGNRGNNNIENLQIINGNHGKGVKMQCSCCGSYDIKTVEL